MHFDNYVVNEADRIAQMKQRPRMLYMYSGAVSFPEGKPTLMDIAISLCREGRYCGAGMRFWTVGLHTMVVCDLLPPRLKIHGWMHDTSECITGDLPKPTKIKLPQVEEMEEELIRHMYKSFDIPFPTPEERAQVKKADTLCLHGEVYTVGTQALQAEYPRCPEAEDLIMKYVNLYSYSDILDAGGRAVIELMKRFREYNDLLRTPKA